MDLLVLPPSEWVQHARCKDADDPEVFFPVGNKISRAQIKTIADKYCSWCPVAADCLGYSLAKGEVGIWGGTTDEQRRSIKRKQSRVKCLRCSSRYVVNEWERQICASCGLSWKA